MTSSIRAQRELRPERFQVSEDRLNFQKCDKPINYSMLIHI